MLAVAAALLLAASPSHPRDTPPSKPGSGSMLNGLGVGLAVGPAFSVGGTGPTWFKGSLRVSYELVPLASNLSLAVVLPLTISGSRRSATISTIDSAGFEVTPSVRVLYTAFPKLRLYGDVGVGLSAYQFTVRAGQSTTGNGDHGSAAGFGARLALGAEYDLIDHLSLLLEPVSLLLQNTTALAFDAGNFHFVDDHSMPLHWGINLGAHYRF